MPEAVNNDRIASLLSYLHGQCAKLSPAEIGAKVDAVYAGLTDALAPLNATQLAFRRGESHWAIAQIVTHLAELNEECFQVAGALARGEAPEKVIVRPVEAEPLKLVTAARQRIAQLVQQMGDSPRLDVTTIYHTFGPVNCKEVFLFERVHALDHLEQVRELIADPGFPARD